MRNYDKKSMVTYDPSCFFLEYSMTIFEDTIAKNNSGY